MKNLLRTIRKHPGLIYTILSIPFFWVAANWWGDSEDVWEGFEDT